MGRRCVLEANLDFVSGILESPVKVFRRYRKSAHYFLPDSLLRCLMGRVVGVQGVVGVKQDGVGQARQALRILDFHAINRLLSA